MSRDPRIVILGARRDGHANVVREAIRRAGAATIVGFLDDDRKKYGDEIHGLPILGPVSRIRDMHATHFIAAVGDCEQRRKFYEIGLQAGLEPWSTIDPAATVLSGATIGPGSVVIAGAVLNVDVKTGCNVIINTAATVDHNCDLGDHVNISPGCHLGGRVHVDEGSFLGLGAVVLPDVRIGAWTIVGAGAVVVDDVEPATVVAGCPARYLRDTSPVLQP